LNVEGYFQLGSTSGPASVQTLRLGACVGAMDANQAALSYIV